MTFRGIVAIVLLLALPGLFAAPPMETGRIGYLMPGMNLTYQKEARIAFSLWNEEMARGENIDVQVDFYDDIGRCMEEYRQQRFDLLAINPYFYMRYRSMLQGATRKLWGIQRGPDLFNTLVVLVRRDSGIAAMADLKGKRVLVHAEDYMGRMFLEKELLEAVQRPAKTYAIVEGDFDRFGTAVLKTYFKGADACVVPQYAFDTVAEMNPALHDEMRALKISDPIFLTFVMMARADISDNKMGAFERNVANLKVTPRGQNILALFRMRKIEPLADEALDPLYDYYRRYRELRERFGGGMLP